MKIEKQVLTIEQAKHLQELGLDMSDAAHFWCSMKLDTKGHEIKKREWYITLGKSQMHCGFMMFEYIPTYTLQEVLDKLPNHIVIDEYDYYLEMNREYWMAYYMYTYSLEEDERDYINESNFQGDNFKDTAYSLLCWVLEKGYLKMNNYD